MIPSAVGNDYKDAASAFRVPTATAVLTTNSSIATTSDKTALTTARQDSSAELGKQSHVSEPLRLSSVLLSSSQSNRSTHSSVNDAEINQVQQKTKWTRLRTITEQRREQCRTNQARYRQRKRSGLQTLEQNIQQLHHEIEILQLRRRSPNFEFDVWTVVVEYFRRFRYGLTLPSCASGPEVGRSARTEQLVFLRSAMADDVAVGELRGIDALFEQWRRYSVYHKDLHLELKRLEKAPDGAIITSAVLSVTVTDSTLQHVFPHLLDSARGDRLLLGARLLGQRLRCRCSLRFEWDNASMRVARFETTMDLVTPLLRILGTLENVANALGHARITPENAIGEIGGQTTG